MGSNSITQGIVVDFKGNLSPFKSAVKDFKSDISSVKTMVQGAGSVMDSAFKGSANSLQSLSSSIKSAGGEATKLSSLQAKAAEAAKRLEVAQAAAALALKRAMDMEQGGKASAEQLAVAQTKAALAAQQVQTRQDQLASATQKVASEEKSLASAMAQDARESMSFSEALTRVKGVLGSVGTGIKVAIEGMSSLASVMGGAAKGAIGSVTSGVKGAVMGLVEFGAKALSSGGQIFSGIEKATSSVMHFKSESSSMHVSFMSGIKNMIGGLLDFTSKLGMAVYGIRSMIDASVGLGKALLSPAADAEQTATAFTGLLGSAQKATAFLKDLRKFAATTPFEFPELAAASRKMLSFGFATRDVIPMMTRLGDAVATMGGGSEEIDRAVVAIGQMHAKTKITADEMNQLTELGIPAWDMLAKSMGKTTAQVMDLSSKGLIPADKGIEALLKGMERFKGGMDAQSKTFKGMLSNLKDGVTMALMAFGGPILDSAKSGLGDLIKLVSSDAFEKFATVTGKGIASIIDRIGNSASKVKSEFEAFSKTIDKISANNFAKGINYLAGQFGYLFGVLGGIGKIIFADLKDDFLKNADLAGIVSGTINRLGNIFHGAGEQVHKFTTFLTGVNFSPFVDGVAKAGGSVAKFIKGIDPIPVQLFFSSISYLGTQLKRTAGIVEGTVLFLFKQLAGMFDVVTGKTTAFHKSFDIVNGVLTKTKSPLQSLIGEGFFKLGAIIAKVAEDVHRFGDTVDNKLKTAFEDVKKAMELPVWQKMGDVLGRLGKAALDLGGSIFSLWTTFSPVGALFKGIGDSGLTFSDVLSSIGDIVDNYVTPAVNGLSNFIKDMGPTLKPIGAQLLGMFMGVGKWLVDNGPTIASIGGKIFSGIGDIIKQVAPVISGDLLPAIGRFGAKIGDLLSDFLKWEDKTGGIEKGMGFLGTAIKDVIGVVTWFLNALSSPQFASFMTDMKNMGMSAIQFGSDIWTRVKPMIENFMHWWNVAWPGTALLLEGVWNGIKSAVQIVWSVISGLIKISLDAIRGDNTAIWNDIKDMIGGVWEGIKTYISGAIDMVKGYFTIGWYALHDIIGKPFDDAWAHISGIFDKIKAGINWVTGQGPTVEANTSNIMTGQHHFAGGVENFKGGFAIVGEKGPEAVRLPRGSDVYTANETKAMLKGMNSAMPAQSNFAQPAFKYPASSSGGAAPVIHNHIYVTVQPTDVKFDIDGYELTNRLAPHQASMIRLEGGVRAR